MRDALAEARRAARAFRLPFRFPSWTGSAGNWAGAGIGSSIDFQDHRPYAPGDDPRHIDWAAYARSEQYVMKLYREEIAPRVDLAVDVSPSMMLEPEKRARTYELFYFAVESALQSGASLRAWAVSGAGRAELLRLERIREAHEDLLSGGGRTDGSILDAVRFRPGSLRLLLSDLLFPGVPDGVLRRLRAERGRAIVLAPACRSESAPDWSGLLELVDCETGELRLERVESERLGRYRASYQRHFQLWERGCRTRGIPFAQIPAEGSLGLALRAHALPARAVEPS